MGAGRYAPSPSGALHFGNVRTAVLAWLFARSTGRDFHMRIEDIDSQRSHQHFVDSQLADLATLGLDWDSVLVQTERFSAYEAALAQLPVYECYCSRKDIQQAASAAHGAPGIYPGTCRDLDEAHRERRREQLAQQERVPALRLRSSVTQWQVQDYYHGAYTGEVDDFILRRGGQSPDWAYNLAVVVDDAAQGVDQVVRGADLLTSAPRQAYLAHLLGVQQPEYVHVPLVVNAQGQRLAKRDGAVTLEQLRESYSVAQVVQALARSLGPAMQATGQEHTVADLLPSFSARALPQQELIFSQALFSAC